MLYVAIAFFQDTLVFYTFFLFIVGSVGNYLTFRVYSSPALCKNTLSLYFRAISIANNYQLFQMIRGSLWVKFNWDMHYINDFFCKTVDYSLYAFNACSAWILVFISIDRFMNIAFPKRFSFLYKRSFQWSLLIFLAIVQPVYYSFMIWNTQLVSDQTIDPNTNETTVSLSCVSNIDATLSWMDLMNSTVVPFTIMIFISILLIYFIRKSRSRINVATSTVRKERTRDRKFAITSLSLNILFLSLNLPPATYNLLAAYLNIQPPELGFLINYFLISLYFTFMAIDFYVQLSLNSIIRDQFFLMLGIKVIRLGQQKSTENRSGIMSINQMNNTNNSQNGMRQSTQ